jgi:hypothetical protein
MCPPAPSGSEEMPSRFSGLSRPEPARWPEETREACVRRRLQLRLSVEAIPALAHNYESAMDLRFFRPDDDRIC